MVEKIISGGQTGADQGGLEAALDLGLETGGKVPKGFKTELGPKPELASLYGLAELASDEYPPRTRYNVLDSDGTVIFGRLGEPGSRMTREMCKQNDKPYLVVEEFSETYMRLFGEFIAMYQIKTLNVAGNRESKFPGLQRKVREFLLEALGDSDEFSEGS